MHFFHVVSHGILIFSLNFRKENEIKVNTFCEWLNELHSKVNKCNIVPSNSIEETLKRLHSFFEEHVEKQSLFSEIQDNVKHFDNNVTVRKSITQFRVSIIISYV